MKIPPHDPAERSIAAQLGAQHPDWHVWWGPGSHRFWAVPCWKDSHVTIVDAERPSQLLAAMSQTERERMQAVNRAGEVVIRLDPGQSLSGSDGP